MEAAEAVKTPDVSMMIGTGGNYDYMVFAKRGKVALGIKPNVITDGVAMYPSVPNTTYIGARLRSAAVASVNWAADAIDSDASNVVTLATAQDEGLVHSWPGVSWEKENDARASTQIGVFIRGSLKDNPHLLSDEFSGKKFVTKLADYLVQLAGGEQYLTVKKRTLRDWLASVYDPHIVQIEKQLLAHQEAAVKVEDSIGTFGMQTALLKGIKDAMTPAIESVAVEDATDAFGAADSGADDELDYNGDND